MAIPLEQENKPRQKTPQEMAFEAKVRRDIGLPEDLPIYPVFESAGGVLKYTIYAPTLDPDKHAEFYGSRGGVRFRSGITGREEVKFDYVSLKLSGTFNVYDKVIPISTRRSNSVSGGRSLAPRSLVRMVR